MRWRDAGLNGVTDTQPNLGHFPRIRHGKKKSENCWDSYVSIHGYHEGHADREALSCRYVRCLICRRSAAALRRREQHLFFFSLHPPELGGRGVGERESFRPVLREEAATNEVCVDVGDWVRP